jgi:hypothetical protein
MKRFSPMHTSNPLPALLAIVRNDRIVLLLCSGVLLLSLWFGPVSLSYLAVSSLIGIVYCVSMLAYQRFRTHRFAILLLMLSVLIITLTINPTIDAHFSVAVRLRYGVWFALQFFALIFTLLCVVRLVLRSPRTVDQQILIVGVGVLVALVIWYRWESTRPIVPLGGANPELLIHSTTTTAISQTRRH